MMSEKTAWTPNDSATLTSTVQSLQADPPGGSGSAYPATAENDDVDLTNTGGEGSHEAASELAWPKRRRTFGPWSYALLAAVVVAVLIVIIVPSAVVGSRRNGQSSADQNPAQPTPTPATVCNTSRFNPIAVGTPLVPVLPTTPTPSPSATPLPALQWNDVGSLPSRQSDQTADTVNGAVYLTGGCIGEQLCLNGTCSCTAITNATLKFDPTTYTFTPMAQMLQPRYRHASCVWRDTIYIFNGRTLTTDAIIYAVDAYNTTADKWTTMANPYPSELGSDNACATVGDTIFVMGGYNADYSVSTNATYRYYPGNDTWVLDSAQMLHGRGDFSAVAINGNVYAYSGYIAPYFCESIDSLEELIPDEHLWVPRAQLGEDTAQKRTGVVLDGRIFCIGGETTDVATNCDDTELIPLREVLSYDPLLDRWRNETWLPIPLFRFSADVVDERLYVFGGQSAIIRNGTETYFPVLDEVYEFNYATNTTPTYAPPGSIPTIPASSTQQNVIPFYSLEANSLTGTSLGTTDFNGGTFELIQSLHDMMIGTHASTVFIVLGDAKLNASSQYILDQRNDSFAYYKFTGMSASDGFGLGGLVGQVDLNSDGKQEAVVGAPSYQTNTGAVYIIYGTNVAQSASVSMANLGSSVVTINGVSENGYCGSALGWGDFDNDGYQDLLIGCPGSGVNAVFLVWGTKTWPSSIQLAASNGCAVTALTDKTSTSNFGSALVPNAFDINNDGLVDVIIGAPTYNNGDGIVYVYYGRKTQWTTIVTLSVQSPNSSGFSFKGNTADLCGWSLANAGDVNNDGLYDLIIGAPSDSTATVPGPGAAYVVFGFPKRNYLLVPTSPSSLNGQNGMRIISPSSTTSFGFSVSTAKDQNGDGIDDFLIGMPTVSLLGGPPTCIIQGAVLLMYGHNGIFESEYDLTSNVDPNAGFILGLVDFCGGNFGSAIVPIYDINEDGRNEMVISAPTLRTEGPGAGSVTIWYGF